MLREGAAANGLDLSLDDVAAEHLGPDRNAVALRQRVGGKSQQLLHGRLVSPEMSYPVVAAFRVEVRQIHSICDALSRLADTSAMDKRPNFASAQTSLLRRHVNSRHP